MNNAKKTYSEKMPKILNRNDRERLAKQVVTVLKVHLGNTNKLSCLDIGCSSGIISNFLSTYFKLVTGIDVDDKAINLAKLNFHKKNLKFMKMNSEEMSFKNNSFDVVVCNQVYNFVDNPKRLVQEIRRVLKKGGVCYFSARNKYALVEPQYQLPFLSWLPHVLAKKYLYLVRGREDFFGYKYLPYEGLKKLTHNFKVKDYTIEILKDPAKFSFIKLNIYKSLMRILPLKLLIKFIPNYIWLLTKK